MINLDTNVLLRHILQDDAAQGEVARKALAAAARAGELVFVSNMVLVEFLWTLHRVYKVPKGPRVEVMRALVSDPRFVLEKDGEVRRAFALWSEGKADFADYLIGLVGESHGARETLTFDQGLRGAAGFRVLE